MATFHVVSYNRFPYECPCPPGTVRITNPIIPCPVTQPVKAIKCGAADLVRSMEKLQLKTPPEIASGMALEDAVRCRQAARAFVTEQRVAARKRQAHEAKEVKVEKEPPKVIPMTKEEIELRDWILIADGSTYRVPCPSCAGGIEVEKGAVQCGVFRHAIFSDGSATPPHSSKEQIDLFLKHKLIRGCGQPLSLAIDTSTGRAVATVCGWV